MASDDLDAFLSELGISKDATTAPSEHAGPSAVLLDEANDFLDWLNEPAKPAETDFGRGPEAHLHDVSAVSEAPTPQKLHPLVLPSLDKEAEMRELVEYESSAPKQSVPEHHEVIHHRADEDYLSHGHAEGVTDETNQVEERGEAGDEDLLRHGHAEDATDEANQVDERNEAVDEDFLSHSHAEGAIDEANPVEEHGEAEDENVLRHGHTEGFTDESNQVEDHGEAEDEALLRHSHAEGVTDEANQVEEHGKAVDEDFLSHGHTEGVADEASQVEEHGEAEDEDLHGRAEGVTDEANQVEEHGEAKDFPSATMSLEQNHIMQDDFGFESSSPHSSIEAQMYDERTGAAEYHVNEGVEDGTQGSIIHEQAISTNQSESAGFEQGDTNVVHDEPSSDHDFGFAEEENTAELLGTENSHPTYQFPDSSSTPLVAKSHETDGIGLTEEQNEPPAETGEVEEEFNFATGARIGESMDASPPIISTTDEAADFGFFESAQPHVDDHKRQFEFEEAEPSKNSGISDDFDFNGEAVRSNDISSHVSSVDAGLQHINSTITETHKVDEYSASAMPEEQIETTDDVVVPLKDTVDEIGIGADFAADDQFSNHHHDVVEHSVQDAAGKEAEDDDDFSFNARFKDEDYHRGPEQPQAERDDEYEEPREKEHELEFDFDRNERIENQHEVEAAITAEERQDDDNFGLDTNDFDWNPTFDQGGVKPEPLGLNQGHIDFKDATHNQDFELGSNEPPPTDLEPQQLDFDRLSSESPAQMPAPEPITTPSRQEPLESTDGPDWHLKDTLESANGQVEDFPYQRRGPMSASSSVQAVPASPALTLDVGYNSDASPAIARLDLSVNDDVEHFEDRRPSRSSSSIPPTPSAVLYAAPSSVRPIPPSERFALWSAALKAFQKDKGESTSATGDVHDADGDEDESDYEIENDHNVCPQALEVLDSIASSKLQGAKLVFGLSKVWGQALGVRGLGFVDSVDGVIDERTGSLLRALFGYHDPELTFHLDYTTSFTWSRRPSLFGFYGGPNPVLELWDMGIVKLHPGFETPQSGSMFFAFGVCASCRTQLLAAGTMEDVFRILDEAHAALRMSPDEASRWAILASRIARESPRTFRTLLSQVAIDLSTLSEFPVYEDGLEEDAYWPPLYQHASNDDDLKAHSEIFSIDDDTPAILPARASGSTDNHSVHSGSSSHHDAHQVQASSTATSTSSTGWAKWKALATQTAKQWQERLAGPIDEASGPSASDVLLAKYNKKRHIHLITLDQNQLGCKMALTKQGLMCVGFPASSPAAKEMERRGLREGDLIHAINGATVLLLPPSLAEAVAQRQERPLHVTVGTSNEALVARPLNGERLSEAKKILLKPLREFYARHGPSKVDRCEEIVRLYAGKERALLKGLFEKYGEFVPGDEYLRCESGAALVTADEIIDYLERPDDREHLIVDIRDITERADTGYFASSVLYGHADVAERLKEAKRVYLIGSGRARELSIADPTRAHAEARLDLERTKIIVERLWKEGIRHVAVVQGGYSQVAREVRQRQADVLITSQGSGVDFRLLDAYLRLDYDDPRSVALFLTNHVTDKATKQRRSSSVVSDSVEQVYASAIAGTRRPSLGSIPSRQSVNKGRMAGSDTASLRLEGEDDDDDDGLLPSAPAFDAYSQSRITRDQISAATNATAKAASTAANNAAAAASSAWSKWVAPSMNKRKQGELQQ